MKERILEFLRAENKSSAQLAEEIGVQPSGISHIISGRNNPSLDFVLKMLEKYKHLSTEWLLFGKGTMYRDKNVQDLFNSDHDSGSLETYDNIKFENKAQKIEIQDIKIQEENIEIPSKPIKEGLKVAKIVWFYSDNSFIEYFPQI